MYVVMDGATMERTPAAVMTHHVVERDGEVWWCRFCKTTWPFPSPVPQNAGPCDPRPWSAEFPQTSPPSDPMDRKCLVCGAAPQTPCLDLRSINRPCVRPHRDR